MDVEQHSPYTLIQTPQTAPGHCFVTKTPNGPFVDTGMWLRAEGVPLENRGRVIISVAALKEMAEIAGIVWEAKQAVIDKYEALLQDEYNKARAEIMQEIEDDPIRRATRELLRAAGGGLGSRAAGDGLPRVEGVVAADGDAPHGVESPDESHGFERSHDVSGAPSDDVPFTL